MIAARSRQLWPVIPQRCRFRRTHKRTGLYFQTFLIVHHANQFLQVLLMLVGYLAVVLSKAQGIQADGKQIIPGIRRNTEHGAVRLQALLQVVQSALLQGQPAELAGNIAQPDVRIAQIAAHRNG